MSQHMEALALAQRIRLDRAAVHQAVKAAGGATHPRSTVSRRARRCAVADALGRECIQSMQVVKLLGWALTDREIPSLLGEIGVQGPGRRVRDLTGRQRAVLCHALRSPDALRGRQAA